VLRHEGFTAPQIAERVQKALRGRVHATELGRDLGADRETATSEGVHRHV
jgi:hypothetical protein